MSDLLKPPDLTEIYRRRDRLEMELLSELSGSPEAVKLNELLGCWRETVCHYAKWAGSQRAVYGLGTHRETARKEQAGQIGLGLETE